MFRAFADNATVTSSEPGRRPDHAAGLHSGMFGDARVAQAGWVIDVVPIQAARPPLGTAESGSTQSRPAPPAAARVLASLRAAPHYCSRDESS